MQTSPRPFEIGEYLCQLESQWNKSTTGITFREFRKSIASYPEFHGKRWTKLTHYMRFYRIYQDYESQEELLAVEPRYATTLYSLGNRQLGLRPDELREIRGIALKQTLTGKMNAEELKGWIERKEWIRQGTAQVQRASFLGSENKIIEALFSHSEDLQKRLGLQLIDRQLFLGSTGDVDVVGLQGTALVMIEVEINARAEDIGQLLSFVGEMSLKRINGRCTMYRMGRQAFNRRTNPIVIECTDVTGWLVAKVFTQGAFYAAYGQQITFWGIGADGNLLTPLDMRTATKVDFEKFHAS